MGSAAVAIRPNVVVRRFLDVIPEKPIAPSQLLSMRRARTYRLYSLPAASQSKRTSTTIQSQPCSFQQPSNLLDVQQTCSDRSRALSNPSAILHQIPAKYGKIPRQRPIPSSIHLWGRVHAGRVFDVDSDLHRLRYAAAIHHGVRFRGLPRGHVERAMIERNA